jgi:signal transduction histidine kinase
MRSRADTANRIVLFLLGLLLLVTGGLGLALSLGAFGDSRATSPVLPEEVRTFPDDQPWFWWAVAGIALLTAILALLWLVAQLRTHRVSRLDQTTDAREGYTTLHAGALTRAVEDEVGGIAGVTSASARIYDRPRHGLALAVGMTDTADIDRLRTQLENDVVAHVREVVGDPEFPVDIELRPDVRRTPARTVR